MPLVRTFSTHSSQPHPCSLSRNPLACCRKGGPRRTDPAKVRSLYVTVRTGAALPRLTVLRNNEDQVGCGSSFRGATRRRSVYFGHKGRTEDRGSSAFIPLTSTMDN